MTQCIPSPHADDLSQLVQQLSRPLSVRKASEKTTHRWMSREGSDGKIYLVVNDASTILVHEKADSRSIAALLAGYVASGFLQQGDLDAMTSAIEAARVSGEPVRVWDLIPAAFKAEAKTWETMVDEGIFTAPGGIP